MNPWKTLGIPEDADLASIKRAFRRLIRLCHPDLHPESPVALRRFLEVTKAYKSLTKALNVQVRVISGNEFEEEISSLFFREQGKDGYSFFYLEVPYQDAFWGRRISVLIQGRETSCKACNGVGYVWDGERPLCEECSGKGYKIVHWGKDPIRILCKTCGATGFSNQARCKVCDGKGFTRIQREVYFPLPLGLRTGSILQIVGDESLGISPTFVEIGIKLPEKWHFDGLDIVSELEIDIWDALLGASLVVKTIEGDLPVEIPQGVSDGTEILLRGRGWIDEKGQRGDHRIILRLKMPKTPPSKEALFRVRELKRLWPVDEDSRSMGP